MFGRMEDETDSITFEELVELKPKMYSFRVNGSSEHRKGKGKNRNVVATKTHGED